MTRRSKQTATQFLIALIGVDGARKLSDAYGGTVLNVPRSVRPGSPLVRVLGEYAVGRLVGGFAGDTVYIPKDVASVRANRDRAIVAEFESGNCVRDLSLAYGLTMRRIQSILANAGARRTRPGNNTSTNPRPGKVGRLRSQNS